MSTNKRATHCVILAILLAVVLVVNTIVFAGVDPLTRLLTAALVLFLVFDMRRLPVIPRLHRLAGHTLAGLLVLQLMPITFDSVRFAASTPLM